jgi:predicted DNA-binding transcriptional regulator YafY
MQTMSEKTEIIKMAAAAGQPIGFCYHGKDDARERRQIIPDPDEPIRTSLAGEQYVIGDDLARGEPRSFTLSKITEVSTV